MKNQPLVIGVAAAVITIVLGIGLVLAVASGDDRADGTAGPDAARSRRSSTSSSRSSTTTTTTTTSKPEGPATTAPTTAPSTPTTATAPDAPHPLDRYTGVELPAGIEGSITSCGWSPADGGRLEASGTVTNATAEDDFWGVSVYWLVWNQTQNEDIQDQYEIYDLAAGQTLQWNLSISYPSAPPNLSCALEVE